MTFDDKMNQEEIDDMFEEFELDDDGMILTKSIVICSCFSFYKLYFMIKIFVLHIILGSCKKRYILYQVDLFVAGGMDEKKEEKKEEKAEPEAGADGGDAAASEGGKKKKKKKKAAK